MAEPRAPPAARPQLSSAMRSSSYLTDHQQYRPPPAKRQLSLQPRGGAAAAPGSPAASAGSQAASYVSHHYPEAHFGIDHVVRDVPPSAGSDGAARSPRKPYVAFNGIPSVDNPPTVVESGLDHGFSHPNCAPAEGDKVPARLVATLFYKAGSAPSPGAPSPAQQQQQQQQRHDHHNHNHADHADHVPAAAASATSLPTSAGSASPVIPENLAPTTNLDKFPLEPPSATEPEHLDHLYGSYISQFCLTSFLHLMSSFPLPADAPDAPTSSHRCLDSQPHPRVVELTLSPAPAPSYLSLADLRKHELIYRFEREWSVDVVLQPDALWRRHPRLVVFDMDSTLITQEVIELLAETVTEKPDLAACIADITARAMAGELEFEGAFRERVGLLKGVPVSRLTDLRSVLNVTRGVRELLRALRRLGVKTAVLSGGFQPLTQWLARELGIDYAHANLVEVDEQGLLTGGVEGTIVGAARKAELLKEIAAKEGVDLSQTVAVGDGANDLEMMAVAGLGVAWHAKPRVQMEAGARLNGESMTDLLYLFGFTGHEIALLCAE
jgi:phosphoserine phosphatase